jgi:hypothetical protein
VSVISGPRPANLRVVLEHLAGGVAVDVAGDLDAAPREFADPVGRQRAFVELGQRFHVLTAGADQQAVDAGPDGRAVALAAGLRGSRHGHRADADAGLALVEADALGALLRQHEGHGFGMRERAGLWHHAVDADRDDAVVAAEYRRPERAATAGLDVAPGQLDRQRDLGLVTGIDRVGVDSLVHPRRQGEVDLCVQHQQISISSTSSCWCPGTAGPRIGSG